MRNRKRYPKDWKKRIRALREAVGNKCQKCGVEHGTKRISPWTGNEWPVWLQGCHVNHDPENPDAEIVIACPYCHWHHYRKPGQRAAWFALERMKHRKLIQEAYCL
jgi:hypothetical protein